MTDHEDHVHTPVEKPKKNWRVKFAEYWKAAIAVGGALLILLNTLVGTHLLHEPVLSWVNTAIAALTAVGVLLKGNKKPVPGLVLSGLDASKIAPGTFTGQVAGVDTSGLVTGVAEDAAEE